MDHSEHGRGDDDGPFDPDCPCVGTEHDKECAEAGCGFCVSYQELLKLVNGI